MEWMTLILDNFQTLDELIAEAKLLFIEKYEVLPCQAQICETWNAENKVVHDIKMLPGPIPYPNMVMIR